MAIDVHSEISVTPRISFSLDLNQTDDTPIEPRRSILDSGTDFDFCISFVHELSSADELFSNGRILPVEIKKKKLAMDQSISVPNPRDQPPSDPEITEKKRLKELLSISFDSDDQKPPISKPFWQFRRSSSLNCDHTRSKSLIRSLQFLARSNSTGSALNQKQSVAQKEEKKRQLQKQTSVSSRRSESSFSGTHCSSYSSSQKRPLKKNTGFYGENGIRISPVLNIPPPYISRATVSFFGFGSLCSSIVKKKKR